MLNVAWLNSIRWPASLRDRAELQVGVVQLAEDLPRGLGHLGLHGQQLFFLLPQRVRLVTQQSLQQQPIRRQRLGGQELLHPGVGNREDFRADVAGRLGRAAGHVDVPPLHPLVAAVGRVFRGFQMGVRAQPLARAVEILVELQAGRQRRRTLAQLALEIRITGDLLLPGRERLFPCLVVRKQARKVPSVGGFDFAARRKFFDGGHGSDWGLDCLLMIRIERPQQ